ncbi:MAG: MaoC family dehydratase [Tissierellia bacterium]|jgi:3-hydroxybutyryl-CoA dehydratase|nr:MaoC family dehydratase [Tissierellia bacterium]HKM00797.1 MaoC family dehydratase [Sedimentibacter sp.]
MNKIDPNSLNMSGFSIDEIYIGMERSVTKTITESDVYTYAGIIGDINPVHVNAEYAKNSRFGERIVHGMLTASFFSTLVGMLIPGADAIYLGQTCKFLLPVKFGDTITAKCEVTSIKAEKKIAVMRTTVVNQKGELVVDGEATVMANAKNKNT